MEDKEILLICECNHSEHQMIFKTLGSDKDEGLDEVYISIHLSKKKFFKRLWIGIRYIFGYQSRYGMFDEIITTKEKLKQIVNEL